jgi:hypothetical protein
LKNKITDQQPAQSPQHGNGCQTGKLPEEPRPGQARLVIRQKVIDGEGKESLKNGGLYLVLCVWWAFRFHQLFLLANSGGMFRIV